MCITVHILYYIYAATVFMEASHFKYMILLFFTEDFLQTANNSIHVFPKRLSQSLTPCPKYQLNICKTEL